MQLIKDKTEVWTQLWLPLKSMFIPLHHDDFERDHMAYLEGENVLCLKNNQYKFTEYWLDGSTSRIQMGWKLILLSYSWVAARKVACLLLCQACVSGSKRWNCWYCLSEGGRKELDIFYTGKERTWVVYLLWYKLWRYLKLCLHLSLAGNPSCTVFWLEHIYTLLFTLHLPLAGAGADQERSAKPSKGFHSLQCLGLVSSVTASYSCPLSGSLKGPLPHLVKVTLFFQDGIFLRIFSFLAEFY